MEARRYLIVLAAVAVVAACLVPAVSGYGNDLATGPHPVINELAFSRVQLWMGGAAQDPDLKNTGFSTGITEGCDSSHHLPCDHIAKKTVRDWVIYGGYAADTPVDVVLSHGYNPLTGRGWDGIFVGSYQPATEWAESSLNPYSFPRAKEYLTTAIAAPTGDDGPGTDAALAYGNAWRSVGESMHMVSDMTMPSHVWIDRHPVSDPFEDSLTRNSVIDVKDKPYSRSVDYEAIMKTAKVSSLMKNLADWTHANFYSEDTIPDVEAGADGYVYRTVDGDSVPAARLSLSSIIIAQNPQYSDGFAEESVEKKTVVAYTVADRRILEAQKIRVIPAAIQGSAMTLYSFLPRFRAAISKVVYNPAYGNSRTGQTVIVGSLVHHPTGVWPAAPAIGNGAFIQVNNNNPIRVLPSGNGGSADLSRVTYIIPAVPGDKVRLFYDFGGYVISSDAVTVPPAGSPSVTPSSTATRKTTAVTTTQTASSPKTTLKDAPPGITCSEWSRSGFGVNNRYCCGPAANGTEVCHITQGDLRCSRDRTGTMICCNTIDDCVEW